MQQKKIHLLAQLEERWTVSGLFNFTVTSFKGLSATCVSLETEDQTTVFDLLIITFTS